jgi:hypothetical protein
VIHHHKVKHRIRQSVLKNSDCQSEASFRSANQLPNRRGGLRLAVTVVDVFSESGVLTLVRYPQWIDDANLCWKYGIRSPGHFIHAGKSSSQSLWWTDHCCSAE